MSPRAWSLAGFALVALIALCTEAGACALPVTGHDPVAARFLSCLHAPRPERRECERAYIAYSGTINTRRH